ncbi:MAG TPA: AEC family transporter [Opitutus sp.]|nr:AEC family transporter [Opitutus sp.]
MDPDRPSPDDAAVLVLTTLAPVFLLIAIGAGLQRSGFVSPGFLKEANRLTYWIGLPALLFSQLVTSFHDAEGASQVLSAMGIATALLIAAAYLVVWALRVPGAVAGTLVQAAFRGNLAFVGLPIIYAMPDTPIAGGMSVRAAAVVVVGPMMVAYNFAGVVVLLLSQHRFGWAMVRPFLRQLAMTPPLIATVAGIIFAMAGWSLPLPLVTTLGALGEMALPLGLLGVGGALMTVDREMVGKAAWAAALIKTVVSPIFGWAVGRALDLDPLALKMLMIFMATPTAVASYAVALELKGDEKLASGAIVLSVLTSVVTLALVIALF